MQYLRQFLISSLDKIEGDLALEQNCSWVETWDYEPSHIYPRAHQQADRISSSGVQSCFSEAPQCLFDTLDALRAGGTFASFAYLSQHERFQRKWPNLYAAVEDGQVMSRLCVNCWSAKCHRKVSASFQWMGRLGHVHAAACSKDL